MARKGIKKFQRITLRTVSGVLAVALLLSACATANQMETRAAPSEDDGNQSEWRRRLLSQMLATVSEPDRQRCEQFADSEADAIKDETASTALGALLGSAIFAGGAPFAFVLFGIPQIISEANRVSKGRAAIYDQTIKECLEPVIIEANLGPEHPDLAKSLMTLADRYRAAMKYAETEPLYQRALAIQEKVLGPKHPDIAKTLEAYASVLARMDRQSEAEEVTLRYLAIQQPKEFENGKGSLGQKTQTDEVPREKSDSESERSNETRR